MAWHWDHVLRFKDVSLLQDLAPHFRQRESVGRRIEVFRSAGILYRLKRDSANARLLESEVDNGSDLIVVQALLERDDQIRGYPVPVQLLQRLLAHTAQISASQVYKGFAFERIKLKIELEVFFVFCEPTYKLF